MATPEDPQDREEQRQIRMHEEQIEALHFLYDKRVLLFNTRRDYEWKIFFGTITLMLALSAGRLIYKIKLTDFLNVLWCLVGLGLFLALALYEYGLQKRNKRDGNAMADLYNEIVQSTSLPDKFLIPTIAVSRLPGSPLKVAPLCNS